MLGAWLRAYPAVTGVKNVDRMFEKPAPASAGRSPTVRQTMQVVGFASGLAADNASPRLIGSEWRSLFVSTTAAGSQRERATERLRPLNPESH